MKYLLIILLFISGACAAQTTYYIRADTVRFQKVGGNTNFVLENSTKGLTGSFLQNYSNGRTKFAYAIDSIWKMNDSTLIVRRGDGNDTFLIKGSSSGAAGLQGVMTLGDSTSRLIEYLINRNGDMTNFSVPNKKYVDSLHGTLGYIPKLQEVFNREPGGSLLNKKDSIFLGGKLNIYGGDVNHGDGTSDVDSSVRVYDRTSGAYTQLGGGLIKLNDGNAALQSPRIDWYSNETAWFGMGVDKPFDHSYLDIRSTDKTFAIERNGASIEQLYKLRDGFYTHYFYDIVAIESGTGPFSDVRYRFQVNEGQALFKDSVRFSGIKTATPNDTTNNYITVTSKSDGNQYKMNWPTILGGGGGSPAGNFGNLQINRNGAFDTPGSDSLDYESATGLSVKGNVNTTAAFTSTGSSGNTVVIETSGLVYDATNNRVGIGTASPAQMLDVSDGTGNLWVAFPSPAPELTSDRDFYIKAAAGSKLYMGHNTRINFTNDGQGVAIGNGYVGSPAPVDGAIIEAQVGIGTNSPVASAKLEIVSTTQGLLPPRMTTTQKNAISSPAEGLIVYDTTLHKLCVYTGSAWETITSL